MTLVFGIEPLEAYKIGYEVWSLRFCNPRGSRKIPGYQASQAGQAGCSPGIFRSLGLAGGNPLGLQNLRAQTSYAILEASRCSNPKTKVIFVISGSSLIEKCQNLKTDFLKVAGRKIARWRNLLYTLPTLVGTVSY